MKMYTINGLVHIGPGFGDRTTGRGVAYAVNRAVILELVHGQVMWTVGFEELFTVVTQQYHDWACSLTNFSM